MVSATVLQYFQRLLLQSCSSLSLVDSEQLVELVCDIIRPDVAVIYHGET
jgi:hypothetical protein